MPKTAMLTKTQTITQQLLDSADLITSKNAQEDYLIKQLVSHLEQELDKKLNINSLSSLQEQFSKI